MPPSRQDLPSIRAPIGDLTLLREEYRERGVGPCFLGEVRASANKIVRRYNASVYSDIGNWRHGFENLVQDVVADSLLRDSQAEYMLQVAATIEDFRRLLARQVRRRLARRRVRTVVDNLIDRARPILAATPFEQSLRHQQLSFHLIEVPVEERAATFAELRAAAQALRTVPLLPPSSADRAPVVFSTPDLELALYRMARVLPVPFTIGELDRVFRLALPQLLPGVLEHVVAGIEGRHDDIVDHRLVVSCTEALLDGLPQHLRVVTAMKIAGSSDAEVGEALGVSRRTAGNRKASAYAVLETVLTPLTYAERVAVLDNVRPALQTALIQDQFRNAVP